MADSDTVSLAMSKDYRADQLKDKVLFLKEKNRQLQDTIQHLRGEVQQEKQKEDELQETLRLLKLQEDVSLAADEAHTPEELVERLREITEQNRRMEELLEQAEEELEDNMTQVEQAEAEAEAEGLAVEETAEHEAADEEQAEEEAEHEATNEEQAEEEAEHEATNDEQAESEVIDEERNSATESEGVGENDRTIGTIVMRRMTCAGAPTRLDRRYVYTCAECSGEPYYLSKTLNRIFVVDKNRIEYFPNGVETESIRKAMEEWPDNIGYIEEDEEEVEACEALESGVETAGNTEQGSSADIPPDDDAVESEEEESPACEDDAEVVEAAAAIEAVNSEEQEEEVVAEEEAGAEVEPEEEPFQEDPKIGTILMRGPAGNNGVSSKKERRYVYTSVHYENKPYYLTKTFNRVFVVDKRRIQLFPDGVEPPEVREAMRIAGWPSDIETIEEAVESKPELEEQKTEMEEEIPEDLHEEMGPEEMGPEGEIQHEEEHQEEEPQQEELEPEAVTADESATEETPLVAQPAVAFPDTRLGVIHIKVLKAGDSCSTGISVRDIFCSGSYQKKPYYLTQTGNKIFVVDQTRIILDHPPPPKKRKRPVYV